LDSAENILANKITALLDCEEPKDLADIWGFCMKMGLPIENAIEHADSKAAGVISSRPRPAAVFCKAQRLGYVDRTGVTNGSYVRCVATGACTPPKRSGS
jgi:hypothetical protein